MIKEIEEIIINKELYCDYCNKKIDKDFYGCALSTTTADGKDYCLKCSINLKEEKKEKCLHYYWKIKTNYHSDYPISLECDKCEFIKEIEFTTGVMDGWNLKYDKNYEKKYNKLINLLLNFEPCDFDDDEEENK